MTKIILASASPRRRQLLSQIGFSFEVVPAACEEKAEGSSPEEIAVGLSMQKAADVAGRIEGEDVLVIGADTIVVLDGKVLGKPKDEADAVRMLIALSGRRHEVYTGVTLIHRIGGKEWIKPFCECTEVEVAPMREGEILDYVKSGEPMDKAGAYGIQGAFAKYITGISGDYFNVVGLPLASLYKEMKQML